VSALDFITLWRAVPFAPFRVFISDGRVVEVNSPHQAAASPDLRLFTVVVSSSHGEVLPSEKIVRCERIGGVPPSFPDVAAALSNLPSEAAAAIAQQQQAAAEMGPPQVGFLSATMTDGVRITSAAVRSVTGRPCFSTAGTRWSAHGLEIFENGCMLYLDHPDASGLVQRMIIWPHQNGTFDTFAEALPFDELARELAARDEKLRASPRELVPPESYAEKTKARPRPTVSRPYADPRGEDPSQPPASPVRIVMEAHAVGHNHEINSPRLETVRTREPVFDLTGTSWDAEVTGGEIITFVLRHWPEGARTIKVEANPLADTANLPELGVVRPLEFVERTLRNLPLHDSWERMVACLKAGPVPRGQPEMRIPVTGGRYVVELWTGNLREGTPFLHPRIVETGGPRDGRVLLDLRGTGWGACVNVWSDEHRVMLRLVHEQARHRWSLLGFPLVVDLPSRRITCSSLPGSTSLAVLQRGAPDWFNSSVMADNLKTMLARGKDIATSVQAT
jgi:hypothetical protein